MLDTCAYLSAIGLVVYIYFLNKKAKKHGL